MSFRYFFDKNEDLVEVWVKFRSCVGWLFDFDLSRKKVLGRARRFSLVSYSRLKILWRFLEEIEEKKVEGCLVECGVWKGGSAALMVYKGQKSKLKREVHLLDSFEGMPEPTKKDGLKAVVFAEGKESGELKSIKKTVGTLGEVKKFLFSSMGLKKEGVYFYKGWFQKTLPKGKKKIGKIAMLRVDADWYESVKICLDELYDQVVKGGYVVFDGYGYWPGCRKAVDEFVKKKGISKKLVNMGLKGAYFIK